MQLGRWHADTVAEWVRAGGQDRRRRDGIHVKHGHAFSHCTSNAIDGTELANTKGLWDVLVRRRAAARCG